MKFLNTILEIVFPQKCLSCGQNGSILCMACLGEAPEAERETDLWISPLYDYRHKPLKDALWFLKYKNKKRLARTFAEILYPRILEELADLSVMENFVEPILIPIPLSTQRLHERGYNQAELICKELINLDRNVNFKIESGVLVKPRETIHQAHIENRAQRLKNIIGSFEIRNGQENKIKNRNIILIDDITTTGATLSEAKKVLRHMGARKVIAFTIAH